MTISKINKILIRLKGAGSQIAFRELYNLCYDRFYRIAYFYAKNEIWSQEIVIDVFVKLWEKRDTLTDILSFEDYCFILIKNAALNYLAKEERNSSVSLEIGMESESANLSPEENFISEELFALYIKEVEQLPERCREVFLRIREEKQSYAQVAREMDISIKTVDAQLQKAQIKIKTALAAYLDSDKEG